MILVNSDIKKTSEKFPFYFDKHQLPCLGHMILSTMTLTLDLFLLFNKVQ